LLGDINYNLTPTEDEIKVFKPSEEQIGYIANFKELELIKKISPVNQLSFEVPRYINNGKEVVLNTEFDLIKGDYLLLYNDEDYYIIIDPEDAGENNATKEIKKIVAYRREYELTKKRVINYSATSRKLYDITDTDDDVGIPYGILNYVEKKTNWTIDVASIPPVLLGKYRAFDFSDSSIMDLLTAVQSAFECIFTYDTINRVIYVKLLEDIGEHKGFFIHPDNYLQNFNKKLKTDNIVTRLRVYGRDNLSINSINATGVDYIEDFSFYKTTDYMSQGLIDSLNTYEALVATKTGDPISPDPDTFYYYLNEIESLEAEKSDLIYNVTTGLNQLKLELILLQDNQRDALAFGTSGGHDYAYWTVEVVAKQLEVDNKEDEIASKQDEIDAVYVDIADLQDLLDKTNNFTVNELHELESFVKVDTFKSDYYDDVNELYEAGAEWLAKLSTPPIQFDMELRDFLKIIEYQHDWDKLVLGDTVTVSYPNFNFETEVRIIQYTYNISNGGLQLQFSNKDNIDDPNVYLRDILSTAISTSSNVDFSKSTWNQSEDNTTNINSILNDVWDTSARTIKGGRNQNIEIGERGIFLKDDRYPGEEVGMLNNIIAFTQDGWDTASLSITPNGVYAPALYSQIIASSILTIENTAGTFFVDENGVTLDGLALTITNNNFVEFDESYNNLTFNATNGIIAENTTDKIKATLNATDGLIFEKDFGSGYEKVFYYDVGQELLVVNGIIRTQDLQDLNGVSMLDGTQVKTSYLVEGQDWNDKTQYHDLDGNITGAEFATDEAGNDQLTLTADGLLQYNSSGQKRGLELNVYGDMTLFWNNSEIFKIGNDIDGFTMSSLGYDILSSTDDAQIQTRGNWDFGFASLVGIDPSNLKVHSNKVHNSQFEYFNNTTNKPYYWDTDGVVTADSNFEDTHSLKLESSQYAIQKKEGTVGLWSTTWWSWTSSRIGFRAKGSSGSSKVKVEILNSSNVAQPLKYWDFNETNKQWEETTGVTYIEYDLIADWVGSLKTFAVTPTVDGEMRIKFTNTGSDNIYIDAITAEPDQTGRWPSVYSDGPESNPVKISYETTGAIYAQDDEPPSSVPVGTLWADTDAIIYESFGVLNLELTGTNDPSKTAYKTDLFPWSFPTATAKQLHFNFVLPRKYEAGTDLKLVFYYSPSNTNTGNINIDLNYQLLNINDTFGSSTTINTSNASLGTTDKLGIIEATISGTNIEPGAMLSGLIKFLASSTFSGTMYLHSVEVFGRSDKDGLEDEEYY